MERLAREGHRERRLLRVAVDRVSDERVARAREVNADLVRAPGLEAGLDESGESEALHDGPLRHGANARFARLRDAAAAVSAVLDEVAVERSRVPRQISFHDGAVAAVHRVRAELRLQPDEAAPAPREHEDAGRLLVEPVDDGHERSLVPSVAPLHVSRDAAEQRVRPPSLRSGA